MTYSLSAGKMKDYCCICTVGPEVVSYHKKNQWVTKAKGTVALPCSHVVHKACYKELQDSASKNFQESDLEEEVICCPKCRANTGLTLKQPQSKRRMWIVFNDSDQVESILSILAIVTYIFTTSYYFNQNCFGR